MSTKRLEALAEQLPWMADKLEEAIRDYAQLDPKTRQTKVTAVIHHVTTAALGVYTQLTEVAEEFERVTREAA